MVRHIFWKDCALLWPFVAALAGLQLLLALARFSGGHFATGLPLVPGSLLELLAAATLIVLAVHQDPIPGLRQDWLVRPIPRRDLFLAKLLFAVILVQGPMFVTDLLQGIANGFSFGQSAAAAAACAVWILLTVSLPVLAFAALTATMTETFLASLGVFAVVIGFVIVPSLAGATRPAGLTGFAWVTSLVREALLLVGTAGVLLLQYRWRRTWPARALFTAALLIGLSVPFMPWRAARGLGQLLTASSQDDRRIAVAFAPAAGTFRLAAGQGLDDMLEKPGFGPADVAAENQRRRAEGARTVFLPVRVSGLTQGSRLLADRSDVTLVDRNGVALYRGPGNDLELRAASADETVHQGIRVPGAVYGRVKGDLIDLHLEYSFTLFRPEATYALPAQHGNQRMPEIGWCATKVDDAGSRILFQCMQPGDRPACLALVLEHPPTRKRNPEVSMCAPDYSPYPGHTLPDALSRFGGRLPFYDPSGLVRYPVGGPELPAAQVLVTVFRPTEHFVRHVVIAGVRLQDWEPQAPAGTAQ